MNLLEILNNKRYDTDKHTIHQYIQEYYENVFSQYKDKPVNLLEIGVLKGESLKLWRDYFKEGNIVGIDIFVREKFDYVSENLKNFNVKIELLDSFKEDAYSINARQNFIDRYNSEGGFDIIIDDGLHTAEAQYKSFYNFKPLMNSGGVYVIEDVGDGNVDHLSQIDGIKFYHLNDKGHPKGKQYIAEIKF